MPVLLIVRICQFPNSLQLHYIFMTASLQTFFHMPVLPHDGLIHAAASDGLVRLHPFSFPRHWGQNDWASGRLQLEIMLKRNDVCSLCSALQVTVISQILKVKSIVSHYQDTNCCCKTLLAKNVTTHCIEPMAVPRGMSAIVLHHLSEVKYCCCITLWGRNKSANLHP